MSYSDAIKLLRKRMMVSQMELADILGVSFMSVSRWESGKFEPTIKVKRELAPLFEKYKIELKEE